MVGTEEQGRARSRFFCFEGLEDAVARGIMKPKDRRRPKLLDAHKRSKRQEKSGRPFTR